MDMGKYTCSEKVELSAWEQLVKESAYSTWFQTPEAYHFYNSVSDLMTPFVYGVMKEESSMLLGVVVGYVTRCSNAFKDVFTRRAIIIGGPVLIENAPEEALHILMSYICSALCRKSIYIETRNFHDYSRYRNVFEQCGFVYMPHLNFQIDTTSLEVVNAHVGKNRMRDIKTSFRDGAEVIVQPTIAQVHDFYDILHELYKKKVRTPLFPFSFFEKLYNVSTCKFLLVGYQGKILGGTVCVCLDKTCVYEWFACGLDNLFKSIFPSSLATYAGIRYAAEHDIPMFDMMGAGTPDKEYGVRKFKARFGGNLVEHGRYLYVCSNLLYNVGRLGLYLMKHI